MLLLPNKELFTFRTKIALDHFNVLYYVSVCSTPFLLFSPATTTFTMTFNVHLVPTIITLIISFVTFTKVLPSAAQAPPPSLRQHLLRNASSLVGVTASYDGSTLFVFLATTTFSLDLGGGGGGSSYSSGEGGTSLNVSQAVEMVAWDFLPMFSAIVGELAKGGGKQQQQSNFSSLPVTIHFLSSVYTFLFLAVEREGEGHSRRLLLLYVQKTYGTGASSRTLTTLLLDRPFAVISRLRGWPPSSSSNDLPPEHSCYVLSMDDQGLQTRIRRGIVEGE